MGRRTRKRRIKLVGITIIVSIIAALVIEDVLSTHIYEIKKGPYLYINKSVTIDACTDPHGEQRGGWRPNYAGFWIRDLKMNHEYIPNIDTIFVKYAGDAPSMKRAA
jgi:hypothetical protein